MAKQKSVKKSAKATTKRAQAAKAKPAKAKAKVAKSKPAKTKVAKSKAAPAAKGPKKFVYFFGNGKADGDRSMKDTLGGKGAGLAEMTNAGLPVPAGFTISTDACNLYYANHSKLPLNIETEMVTQLRKLEKAAGATLGGTGWRHGRRAR